MCVLRVEQGREPLLMGLEAPSDEDVEKQPETLWQRWRVTVGATCAFGGSLACRILDASRVSNALGSFGVGFFASAALNAAYRGTNVEQVRKIGLTVCGVIPVFFLSQLWANTTATWVKTMATHAIIGSLGANVQMFSQWLYEKGGPVRIESHAYATLTGERFKPLFPAFSKTVIQGLKIGAAAGAGALYFTLSDPVSKGIFAFWSLYYAGQVVGERFSAWVDRKIAEKDSDLSDASLGPAKTNHYRILKLALNTAGFFAIPLSFIPWTTNPHTAARVAQLFVVGAIVGLFDGLMYESVSARVRNFPVSSLEEYQSLKLPGEEEAQKCSPFKYVAYKVWRMAAPILAIGGLVAFTVWQDCYVLPDQNSKTSLGSMLGGFLGFFTLSNVVDWTFDEDKRHWLRDKLMKHLLVTPRILGINPLYYYFVGTNALAMDNSAIENGESSFRMAVIVTSWTAYGASMALELQRTWGMRRGALFSFPMMVVVNAAMTMKLNLQGLIV